MKKELIKRIISTFVLIPLVFYFIIKGSYFFTFFLFLCFLISVYEWKRITKKNNLFITGLIFLSLSFLAANTLRVSSNDDYYTTFLIVIIVCISTDIGGYVFGKFFKGPKLTKISPNKTYAGLIGSYFLSIISFYIIYIYNYLHNIDNLTFKMFMFVILISTISQLGDLIISYFKRKSKLKNSGSIIPGHGGLLDRIDGMIFAFPFAYCVTYFLKLKKKLQF